jgi:hypothetical protein
VGQEPELVALACSGGRNKTSIRGTAEIAEEARNIPHSMIRYEMTVLEFANGYRRPLVNNLEITVLVEMYPILLTTTVGGRRIYGGDEDIARKVVATLANTGTTLFVLDSSKESQLALMAEHLDILDSQVSDILPMNRIDPVLPLNIQVAVQDERLVECNNLLIVMAIRISSMVLIEVVIDIADRYEISLAERDDTG